MHCERPFFGQAQTDFCERKVFQTLWHSHIEVAHARCQQRKVRSCWGRADDVDMYVNDGRFFLIEDKKSLCQSTYRCGRRLSRDTGWALELW
jgi:hypothetical protein